MEQCNGRENLGARTKSSMRVGVKTKGCEANFLQMGFVKSRFVLMGQLKDIKLAWLHEVSLNNMDCIIMRHLGQLQRSSLYVSYYY